MSDMNEITQILARIESGEREAIQELLSSVYDELRVLASRKMHHEPGDHTLQATALVHEAYLRLVDSDRPPNWQNRRHFFGAAAEAMRRVLVDAARRRKRLKRGGHHERTFIDLAELPHLHQDQDVEEVDAALSKFVQVDPQKAEVVKLRFYAGLTIKQTAEVMGISTATVERYWTYGRAWLFRELSKSLENERH